MNWLKLAVMLFAVATPTPDNNAQMGWPQAILLFATGAGGFYSFGQLIKLMKIGRERKGKDEAAEQQAIDKRDIERQFLINQVVGMIRADQKKLFPNGERDEIITKIDDLIEESRRRRKEHRELSAVVEGLVQRIEHLET